MPSTLRSPLLLPIFALAVLSGCVQSQPSTESGDSEAGDTGEPGETGGEELGPTWWQDVAPIYYESCVSCHREGGIGPFELDDYESASTWGLASKLAVQGRVMPPWLVTDDGTCNSWQDSAALSQEQIDTITAWVDAGTPEGTPRDDLELPELEQLTNITAFVTPEFVPEPEGSVVAKYDEYRCFLIDPNFDHDMFMTGYQVKPGNEALVHHVLAMPIDPNRVVDGDLTNMDLMQAYDDESPDRLGWPCLGLAGEGVEVEGLPVSWAPGQGMVELPPGAGFRLGADHVLVVQVHYNMVDASLIGQSDSTTVEMQLVDTVEREGLFDIADAMLDSLFTDNPHIIPAGEPAHQFTWRVPADWWIGWQGTEQLELWGFFPHMHSYGTSLTARVLDANGQEVDCVGEVPRWDFGWQLYYFMEQPIILESGYEIEVTCTYDTTNAPADMLPGWGTFNEMCLVGMFLVAP